MVALRMEKAYKALCWKSDLLIDDTQKKVPQSVLHHDGEMAKSKKMRRAEEYDPILHVPLGVTPEGSVTVRFNRERKSDFCERGNHNVLYILMGLYRIV